MMDDAFDTILIQEEEAGERLDKVLARRFQDVKSRTYFQFLIDQQHVLASGLTVKKRHVVRAGEEIQIRFILTPEMGLDPEPIPLSILYEDSDLIVVNKPAGMVVHPAPGNWKGTFANALLHHCMGLQESFQGSLRPGIVHRLDKDTSGLLIAAKSSVAHQRLIALFAERRIEKDYLTVCLGNPGKREICAPIGRHAVHRKMMAVVESGGREALTFCEPIEYKEPFCFARIRLATGRTHQIRVHLKHINCPVVGDSVYGNERINEKYEVKRQLLHASMLRFIHPIKEIPLEFMAPLPEDFYRFIKKHFGDEINTRKRMYS